MARKTSPPQFDPSVYTKINLNDLVVYAVHSLDKPGTEAAAEDIVRACFILFPERFSLRRYPQWPDSAVVSRRWSDCKSRGYLVGNAVMGFKLTARGLKRAGKLEKLLGRVGRAAAPALKRKAQKTEVPAQFVHPEVKVRAGKYVRSIEASDAHKHYRKKLPLNEYDFRSLLLCTMESPPATLSRNLEQFKEYVNIYERKDLMSFLVFCEARFSHLLNVPQKETKRKARRSGK